MDESIILLAIGEGVAILFYHWLKPLLVLSVFSILLVFLHRKKEEPLVYTLLLSWLFWLCWSSSFEWPSPGMGFAVLYTFVSAGLGIFLAVNPSNEFRGATPKAGFICALLLLLGMLPVNLAPRLDTHYMLIQTAMHIGVPYLLQRTRQRQGKFVNAPYIFASSFWLITSPLFPGTLFAGGFGLWLVGQSLQHAKSDEEMPLARDTDREPDHIVYIPANLKRPGFHTKQQRVEEFDVALAPVIRPHHEPVAITELPLEHVHLPDP